MNQFDPKHYWFPRQYRDPSGRLLAPKEFKTPPHRGDRVVFWGAVLLALSLFFIV